MIGTGGLSHQLDGERAGFINKDFDQLCMDKLVADPEALTGYSIVDLVELAGTQGVEMLNWIAMRGAIGAASNKAYSNYHIPISNTAAAPAAARSGPNGGARGGLRPSGQKRARPEPCGRARVPDHEQARPPRVALLHRCGGGRRLPVGA